MKKLIIFIVLLIISFFNIENCLAIEEPETSSSISSQEPVEESKEVSSSSEISSSVKLSNDANLKSLKINNGVLSPNFSPNTTNYSLTVNENISSVTFSASCNNCKSISGLGSFKVYNGTNNHTIKVVSEDGLNTKTYNIYITKKESNNEIDNSVSADLKSLKVRGYKISPEFSKLINEYTVTINKGEKSIYIDYEAVENEAIVTIKGNKNLKIGVNKITIIVTNGKKEQVYYLTVNKEKAQPKKNSAAKKTKTNSKKKDYILISIICGSALLIILIAWYFIFMHKKVSLKRKVKKLKKNKINEK